MSHIEHPSKFIDGSLTDVIRISAQEAEIMRRLHPNQLSVIRDQNWLNIFVPTEYGGLGLSLTEGVRIEECLSWADGSTGWVVTLCSGAAWFSGFLSREALREIFSQDHVCFAGSGAPTGTARVTDKGYEVSGYWKYASGSLQATVFTANCIITRDGEPVRQEDGTPLIRSFWLKKEEAELHFHWNSMGMIATGSHGFKVAPIHLDHHRSFVIDPKHAVMKQALYQFPFLQLAEVTLAANLSGMAVRFMDLCEVIFEDRMKHKSFAESQKTVLQQKMAAAQMHLQNSRQEFYRTLQASWEMNVAGKPIPKDQLLDTSARSHQLAKASRRCVDDLYPYCGLTAANTATEINRVWRNFHTAGQHDLFASW